MLSKKAYNRSITYFLIASIAISLLMRFPTSRHETGIDSFFIHDLANSICTFGEIRWDLSILSYFGYYPFSYPSAVPIILAELHEMTRISVEMLILLISMLTGIIASITAFAMALELRRSPIFGFAVSITYASAPLLLFMTQWTVTTRGLFIAFLPLIFLMLIKFNNLRKASTRREMQVLFIVAFVLILLLMNLFHRLAILLIFLIASYFIARISTSKSFEINLSIRLGQTKGKVARFGIISFLFMMLFIPLAYFSFLSGWFGLESYETGFFAGNTILSQFLNLMASVAASIGFPISFLFPIAIFLIYRKKENWTFINIFLLLIFLFLLPLSGNRTYERIMYPLVLIPFIMLAAHTQFKVKFKKIYRFMIALSIVFTLLISNLFLLPYWNDWPKNKIVDDGNSLSDQTFMTSIFMGYYYPGEHFIGNNWIANIRIQAISICPEIPNALRPTYCMNILIYNILSAENLNIEPATLDKIIKSQGVLFESQWELKPASDWIYIFLITSNPEKTFMLLSFYNITLFVEDLRLKGRLTGWYSEIYYPLSGDMAPFIVSTYQSTYSVYDNGRERIWII